MMDEIYVYNDVYYLMDNESFLHMVMAMVGSSRMLGLKDKTSRLMITCCLPYHLINIYETSFFKGYCILLSQYFILLSQYLSYYHNILLNAF